MPVIDENVILWVTIYGGVVLVVFWVAMVIWAYRDMRARSRDTLAQLFVAAVVTILNLPGLFIYIMLRPRETLSEAYERSLEEEALLQEIEEKPDCPGCGQRVGETWQACAYCHTRLKKPCRTCNQLLELSWKLCPYCATPQRDYNTDEVTYSGQHVTRADEPLDIDERWLASSNNNPPDNMDYPQYVDDEY
jgi:hypothetical protein